MWPIFAELMEAVGYAPASVAPGADDPRLRSIFVDVTAWLLRHDSPLQEALIDAHVAANFPGSPVTLFFDTAPWLPLHTPLDPRAVALECARAHLTAPLTDHDYGAWTPCAFNGSPTLQWQWLRALPARLRCPPIVPSLTLDALPVLCSSSANATLDDMCAAAMDKVDGKRVRDIAHGNADTLYNRIGMRRIAQTIPTYKPVTLYPPAPSRSTPPRPLRVPFVAASLGKLCAALVATPPDVAATFIVVAPDCAVLARMLAWADLDAAAPVACRVWLEVAVGNNTYVNIGALAQCITEYARDMWPAQERPVAVAALLGQLAGSNVTLGRALCELLGTDARVPLQNLLPRRPAATAASRSNHSMPPPPPRIQLFRALPDAAAWLKAAWQRSIFSARPDGLWTEEITALEWYLSLLAHGFDDHARLLGDYTGIVLRAAFDLFVTAAAAPDRTASYFHLHAYNVPGVVTGWTLDKQTALQDIAAAVVQPRRFVVDEDASLSFVHESRRGSS